VTPDLDFNVVVYLKSNISKRVRLTDKVTIYTNRKPYLTYQTGPCLVTLTDLLKHCVDLSASAELLVLLGPLENPNFHFLSILPNDTEHIPGAAK